ncbi:MAG: aspartate-semialdehyde dehydrogenase [Clostridiales bacterium]|nr:aspartate-semialdehyde dehydrogenase [Clostridiales bacterium]
MKYKVGIVGATGMVGQRLVGLLQDHPWFTLRLLAASARSAGRSYGEAVAGRWQMDSPLPPAVAQMEVQDAAMSARIADEVDFIFCAVSLPREQTQAMEEGFAKLELPVISNNSALRMRADVPMIIPEINADHARVLAAQRRRLGTARGFVTVKPNCSIQSYVPALSPLMDFEPQALQVSTYQAVSGAGRRLMDWPQMQGNLIPFIPGEEEKSEREPLKIWGRLDEGQGSIQEAALPRISAQCVRVPVSDGHLATVSVSFRQKPQREDILARWANWRTLPQRLGLPSAPDPFLVYREEDNRPQPLLDRDAGQGMAVVLGRLREDPVMDWRFISLSHNTLRGAAGGSVLTAELLCKQGYIPHK